MKGGIHKDIQLPCTEPIELYHNALSSCSQKVRLCLAYNNISYKSNHIDMLPRFESMNDDNRLHTNSPEYTFINPGRIVPTLVYHGNPVYESSDMLKFILTEIVGQQDSLIPSDCDKAQYFELLDCAASPGKTIHERTSIENVSKRAGSCVPGISAKAIAVRGRTASYTEIMEQILLAHNKPIGIAHFGGKLLGNLMNNMEPIKSISINAEWFMKQHLKRLNDIIVENDRKYILSDEISMVDYEWIIILERCRAVGLLRDDYKIGGKLMNGIARYWEFIENEEYYKEAILYQDGDPLTLSLLKQIRSL